MNEPSKREEKLMQTPSGKPEIRIQEARKEDVPLLVDFIGKMANYEKLTHLLTVDEATLEDALFGPRPATEALILYWEDKPVGMAFYFHNFSTFTGHRGLYLEDLFIEEAYRKRGIGRAALIHLAGLALERDCKRFEWTVLNWNQPAIDFYKEMGADILPDWRICRIAGDAMDTLAVRKP